MSGPAAQAGPAAFAPFTAANAVPGGSAESCTKWPDAAIDPLTAGPLPADEEAWVRDYGRQVKAKKRIPFL